MLTIDQATQLPRGKILHHVSARNANGTPLRCRVNGKCYVWKTRVGQFRLPVVHGLKDYFYITHHNQKEWEIPND